MGTEGIEAEEEMKLRQDAALYPVGRALRTTFDAENHDTLGGDVTGLMLQLSRIPFDADRPCARDPATASAPPAAIGWLGRVRGMFAR